MIKDIYKLMLIYGFKPDHKLNQNFIIDNNIIKKVIETLKINKKETILEIGPGLGFLTKELLTSCKKVIAIEKDPLMIEILKKEINTDNLEIINSNFLDVDLSKLKFDKIAGFIPYSISLKIMEKILATKPACLVVQREFAEKLAAFEGFSNYVAITALVQNYSEIKIIKNIGKGSFFPKPKVESAIISIIPNNKKVNLNYNLFVKNIFRYGNKDIKNSLKHASVENKNIVDMTKLNIISEKMDFKKVKQLSVPELEAIFKVIKK
jgi:16S rRNA (adenine1518-N6/adenine1519-N6)-dimethyltransferase